MDRWIWSLDPENNYVPLYTYQRPWGGAGCAWPWKDRHQTRWKFLSIDGNSDVGVPTNNGSLFFKHERPCFYVLCACVYIYIPILETRSWNHLGRHVWNSLGFTELILAPWASQSIPRSQTQPKVSSWSRRTTVAARKRLMDEMSKVDPLPDTNGW